MKTSAPCPLAALGLAAFLAGPVRGQLLQNLTSFSNSVSLIDPTPPVNEDLFGTDGPKEIASGDFDGDGHPDLAVSKVFGRVAVVFGLGDKQFAAPLLLDPPAGTGELRGITVGDFDVDGRPDVAVAAPYSGLVVIFKSLPGRTFAAPEVLTGWNGVRNLAAADLDADGRCDLVLAGPIAPVNGWISINAELRPAYNQPAGWQVGPGTPLPIGEAGVEEFPKPTFAIAPLPPGPGGQWVAVTHASAANILLVRANPAGDPGFTVVQELPALLPTQSLAVGTITTQAGPPDLVAAARDDNQLILRKGRADRTFETDVAQRLFIPGKPRAAAVADVDADGWNDLLVVLRDFDRVVTFHNDHGTLKLAAEAPTGSSPRDLIAADFNNDGRADAAVANRDSDNISILLTQAAGAGFERLDTVYAVDGGVSALVLADVNADGRADAVQSHLLTNEISVRLSLAGGLLAPPTFTKLNSPPVALRPGDFNGDGRADLIVVHSSEWAPGLSVLLGNGNGTFAAPSFLPATGGLFAITLADLDADGISDAIAGFYDCRLATYKGLPDGSFEPRRIGLFNYESRAMAVGDFDQDGDIDIAGASAMGELTIVENDGHLLETTTDYDNAYVRRIYRGGTKSRIKSMGLVETNGDADPDIVINSQDGVSLYESGPGLLFVPVVGSLPGTKGASDLVIGDFDGDGRRDIASACRLLSCVVVLKGEADGSFAVAAVAPVPSADMIASGDIDGDGLADLAGSGEVLWTALSSRSSTPATGTMAPARAPVDSVVINELLASNLSLPIPEAAGKTADVIELYNGRSIPVDLAEWKLTYLPTAAPGAPPPAQSILDLSAAGALEPGDRKLIVCDGTGINGHAPFKLAKEGGTLTLRDASNAQKDAIAYSAQDADVSYGRYSDGSAVWSVKEDPDPGQPNYMPADGEGPRFRQVTLDPATLKSTQRPVLLIKAADDVGIFTLSAIWKWRNPPPGMPSSFTQGRVGLFDDGMNGDGAQLDGLFAGTMPTPFPAGAKIEFFLDATNLVDQTRIAPGDPAFSLPGQTVTNYSFTITAAPQLPGLEISELQMHSAVTDELGDGSDFIEIRNTGAVPFDFAGIALRDGLFSTVRTKTLTGSLAPGEHRFYYADSDVLDGPFHLPFKLNKSGDSVWLVSVDALGVVTVLDSVDSTTPTSGILSWSRLGPGGPFTAIPPTPNAPNLQPSDMHIELLPGFPARLRLAYFCPTGVAGTLESLVPSQPAATWLPVGQSPGTGFETSLDILVDPAQPSRFFPRPAVARLG